MLEHRVQKLKTLVYFVAVLSVLTSKISNASDTVAIRDAGVEISEAEMAAMIEAWTDEMRSAAARDKGERFELLTSAIMSRKMAQEAETATPDDPGYWDMQFKILNIKQRYVFDQFLKQLDIPDFEALARERYETDKDKYAKVPEHRKASHILLRCIAANCNRNEIRPKAQELLEELRNGADFEKMVAEYSEDPGSKARDGKLQDWIRMGDPKLIPEFVGGLFEIEKVGGYSEVTDTRFGLHIIRMDALAPEFYQPYERVRDTIIADLEKEYKQLAAKEFRAGYLLSEEAYINGDVMDRLFAPYSPDNRQSEEVEAVDPKESDVSADAAVTNAGRDLN